MVKSEALKGPRERRQMMSMTVQWSLAHQYFLSDCHGQHCHRHGGVARSEAVGIRTAF